jgi:hypothetical protein
MDMQTTNNIRSQADMGTLMAARCEKILEEGLEWKRGCPLSFQDQLEVVSLKEIEGPL